MSTDLLVSVIIPTYNCIKYLPEAIDSVLEQTYKKTEIIIIDDGSTDKTKDIITKKYGKKITYIYHSNRGLAISRNVGINVSNGKYIQFLDADDVLLPEKLSLQVQELESAQKEGFSYCNYKRSNTETKEEVIDTLRHSFLSEDLVADIIINWESKLSIPPHCFVFSSELFKKYSISFDPSLESHEDWKCWVEILLNRPHVIHIDKVLVDYRIRPNSMCTNRELMRRGFIRATNELMKFKDIDLKTLKLLQEKKREIKKDYRDVSMHSQLIKILNPKLQFLYREYVPWRLQTFLDEL